MDDFVQNKLTEWGLSEWIERFHDEGIDKESFFLLDQDDQELKCLISKVGPRMRFKERLSMLKEESNINQDTADFSAQTHEEADDSAQVMPSTSYRSDQAKRKLDHQDESSKRRRDTSYSEKIILSDVDNLMRWVHDRLPNQVENKLGAFLREKINDLRTDRKELVGVFGKTGAGKSSLINAVIGEKNLLPSGDICACTSVIIKVEANMQSKKYEAEIEFIAKEEWKDELWSLLNFLKENAAHDDDDYHDSAEKLTALYGEEWKDKSPEDLMDNRHFKEIPEFLRSTRKVLTGNTAEELSVKFVRYTRSDIKDGELKGVKKWYWPLTKCVTIRVPDNDFLQHVTLVDLPGNGDRNKSRDQMWKGFVGRCSTVWIVTERNRAAAEKETWDILKSIGSDMGNGGECQQIHFICTKCDVTGDSDDYSDAAVRALTFKKNKQAKEEVTKEYNKLHSVKKHFGDECFKVFAVSSKEFLRGNRLSPDENEIPKLREFLQNLNDCHSVTLNYVTGAYGILSLIQAGSHGEAAGQKTDACAALQEKMKCGLDNIKKSIEEAHKTFERSLSLGVENSRVNCEKDLKNVLNPRGVSGSGFHKTLTCVVANNGSYQPKKKGGKIDLNRKLSSRLTESIDEKFRKTFPNEGKCGPFNGVISTFTLDIKKLIQNYKDVALQLIFLNTEEKKIKTKLNIIIRERKKVIYRSLEETISKTMDDCYKKAKEFRGQDVLKNTREALQEHVHNSKNTMFQEAKEEMLSQLSALKEEILKTLGESMQESIRLSLRTDCDILPDVTAELIMVKNYFTELKRSSDEETDLV